MNKNESERSCRKNKVFWIQSIIFLLLLLNAFEANTISDNVILMVAMIMPFFMRSNEIAAYIVGFSMMGTGIQIAYVALSCLVSLLIKSNCKIKKVALLSLSFFACYEFIHFIMSANDEVIEFVRYFVVYALLFYVMFMKFDNHDKIRIIHSYMFGTLFSLLHVFIETYTILNGNLLRLFDGSLRFGYSDQIGVDLTLSADPNAIGQGCSIVIVISLMLIMLGYKEKRYYIVTVVGLIVGTLTISKTFLISLVFIFIFMLLYIGSWRSYKMIERRILLVALVIFGGVVISLINPKYIENILLRVDPEDITTGRTTNAMIYMDHLIHDTNHFLFGVGMQNVSEKIAASGSPHAAVIEALVCWGIVGTLIIFSIIIYAFICNISKKKTSMLNWVPLMVYCVIMQTTQLFRLRDRVFTIIVLMVTVGINKREDNKKWV